MALPVATVKVKDHPISYIAELINEYEPLVIYVGLPLNLQGEHTASTQYALDFADALKPLVTCEIRLIDERLSTVSAASTLRSAGHTAQSSKDIIDQAAAVVILEHALDVESKSNQLAGQPIGE
jgi:putative Holliday junction resolvase